MIVASDMEGHHTRRDDAVASPRKLMRATAELAPEEVRRYGTPWIVEFVMVMLRQLVPTAVPALVMLPDCAWVQ